MLTKTEIEDGLHASLAETSLMLALKPELVGDERPNEGIKGKIPEGWSLEGNAPTAWLTDDFSKSGVIGDSRGANESLGKNLKELLINGHGGQISLLNTAARELRSFSPGMAVFPCFLWSGVDGLSELLTKTEIEDGLHASLAETSLMLALKPELVGDERPNEGLKGQIPEGWSLEGNAPTAWLTDDFSKSGVIGDSRGANESLGKNLKELLINHWFKLIMNLMQSDWPNNS